MFGPLTIKVQCHTNLDEFKLVEWPAEMVCRPQVGDYVEGRRGETGPGSRPRLRVVAVTHSVEVSGPPRGWGGPDGTGITRRPVFLVELHK